MFDWLHFLAVPRTLKSLQHHSSKASILRRSAFFTVQLSHPHMTTGKSIALTRQTFVSKVIHLMSRTVRLAWGAGSCLLFNTPGGKYRGQQT